MVLGGFPLHPQIWRKARGGFEGNRTIMRITSSTGFVPMAPSPSNSLRFGTVQVIV